MNPRTAFIIGYFLMLILFATRTSECPLQIVIVSSAITGLALAYFEWNHNKKIQSSTPTTKEVRE